MNRRTMLTVSVSGGAGVLLSRALWPGTANAAEGTPKLVTIVEYSEAGVRGEVKEVPKVTKTPEEWRGLLTPIAFQVARKEGTERGLSQAFSLELLSLLLSSRPDPSSAIPG
jgi:hypothetical protein